MQLRVDVHFRQLQLASHGRVRRIVQDARESSCTSNAGKDCRHQNRIKRVVHDLLFTRVSHAC